MPEPLVLRDEGAAPGLVVVRLGAVTLTDEHLRRSVEECHARWGLWGFSVLEVPDGDFTRLARLRPIVAERRQVLVADGGELVADGFPLLPTWTHRTGPSRCPPRQPTFSGACALISAGRLPTPATEREWIDTMKPMEESAYDLWYEATAVGADLVVETWISHGPRADDTAFDPQPGDFVAVGDDDEPPLKARVVRRAANRVWVQVEVGRMSHAV